MDMNKDMDMDKDMDICKGSEEGVLKCKGMHKGILKYKGMVMDKDMDKKKLRLR